MAKLRMTRQLARRKQPSIRPSHPSACRSKLVPSNNDQEDVTSSIRTLPFPSAFSPRHPSNFRWETGLHKYTTGPVSLSDSIFSASSAAFKVYSTAALSRSQCVALRQLICTEDKQLPAEDLASFLSNLYRITARVYTLVDSAIGVFFQIFQPTSDLRTLRLPWTIIPAWWRQWNMGCEIFRNHSQATISVPHMFLSIPNIGAFRGIQTDLCDQPTNNWIKVHIGADILRSTLKANPVEGRSISSISVPISKDFVQRIVDGIVCAVKRTVRSNGTDPVDTVSEVKTSITSFLRTSQLRSLVEFRDLEITLYDAQRQRYVENVLLNSDGSERSWRRDEQRAPETAIQVRSGSKTDNILLSEHTQQKLDIKSLSAIVPATQDASSNLCAVVPQEMAQEFDTFCRNSVHTGLRCCVAAVQHLSNKNSGTIGHLVFQISKPGEPSLVEPKELRMNVNTTGGQGLLTISMQCRALRARMLDSENIGLNLQDITLHYGALESQTPQTVESDDTVNTAIDETFVISRGVQLVLENAMKGLEFASVQEMPLKLAEILLEVLKPLLPGITLQKVQLSLMTDDDPHTTFRGGASLPVETLTTTAEPSALPESTRPASSKNIDQMKDFDSTTQGTPNDKRSVEAVQDFEGAGISYGKRSLPVQRARLHQPAFARAPKKGPNYLMSGWMRSDMLTQYSGAEQFFVELWRPSSTPGPIPTLTEEQLLHSIVEGFESSSESQTSSFRSVLERLTILDPLSERVRLSIRVARPSLTSLLTRSGSKPDLQILYNSLSQTHSGDQGWQDIYVQLPSVQCPVRLEGREIAPAARAHLSINLRGLFPHAVPASKGKTANQISHLAKDVYSLVSPRLRDQTFSDFQTLVDDLGETILESRVQFSPVIDIQNVQVSGALRVGDFLTRALEKAHASKNVIAGFDEDRAEEESFVDNTWEQEMEVDERTEMSQSIGQNAELSARSLAILEPAGHKRTIGTIDGQTEVSQSVDVDDETSATRLAILDPLSQRDLNGTTEVDSEGSLMYSMATGWKDGMEDAQKESELGIPPGDHPHTAYIALGSNMGDRLKNIENACNEMDAHKDIRVIKTSPLYETDAMYVEDQDSFLNGVCKIDTTLQPMELLDALQAIEDRLGRVKTIDKGPRSIDLDILLYDELSMQTERLTIPHPLMHEREFVLRPLHAMDRESGLVNVKEKAFVRHALKSLPKASGPLYPLAPLGLAAQYLHPSKPAKTTRIMSILNMTPDSFSDGGENQTPNIETLKDTIRSQINAGASIIDVGGQSSRPNAPDVSAEEEISRILPAIEAIKSLPEASNVAISVDTYRARVAEAAVNAGAHIINDISAGKLDSKMLSTIARLGCTYIMMHMRGTPSTMMLPQNCRYPNGVVAPVYQKLARRAIEAQKAGIRRWRIILDPGIGFSKTPEQNVKLLKQLQEMRDATPNYPWLIGTSRKSFIGKLTGVEDPKQRVWGTAATVTAAVMGGADIVRVHDVKEMADVVKMADAMYRA